MVNLAVKIQAQAPPGGTCLGQIAVQSLHTRRRKVCEDVNAPADWSYKDERSDPYRFYGFGVSA